MRTRIQRARGAVGIGLTWAVGWAPIGAFVGWLVGALLGLPVGTVTINYAVTFGVLGLVAGAIFAVVLRVAERGRRFDRLSLGRFAAWGAVGGLLLGALAVVAGLFGAGPGLLGVVMAGAATLLGAGSAAATLAIARAGRGEARPVRDDDLADDADADTVGARELLGSAAAASFDPAARQAHARADR